jgi:hypothetical protein
MFHWMYISHFVGPFCWWTFCLHPRFNYCDQCWYEHGGRSFNLHFPCKVLRIREVATCPRLQPEIVQGGFWTWVHLTLQLIFVSTKIHTFAQGVPTRGVEEFFFFFCSEWGLGFICGNFVSGLEHSVCLLKPNVRQVRDKWKWNWHRWLSRWKDSALKK